MNLKKPTRKWSGKLKNARCVYRRLSDDLFSVLSNLAGRRPGNRATLNRALRWLVDQETVMREGSGKKGSPYTY
jgi:hypothetical protein